MRDQRRARTLATLSTRLQTGGRLPNSVTGVRQVEPDKLAVELIHGECTFRITVTGSSDSAWIAMAGTTALARRFLRNALIGRSTLIPEPRELHILDRLASVDNPALEELLLHHTRWLDTYIRTIPNELNAITVLPAQSIGTYWWDAKPNFGDSVGPWLIELMTGKTAINQKRTQVSGPVLYTAGSVFGHIDSSDSHVWGSGMIDTLTDKTAHKLQQNRPAAIHAVRGELTRQELTTKLGWDVPAIFGDPAVLLPRVYSPAETPIVRGKVAIVPHYAHRRLFTTLDESSQHMVDVRQDPATVINEIAGAQSCISTSLHGVIIAHAYGVPWVWLRVADSPLHGDNFKFEDFFTCLDRNSVATVDVAAADVGALDKGALARKSRLPATTAGFDDLWDAFPYERR